MTILGEVQSYILLVSALDLLIAWLIQYEWPTSVVSAHADLFTILVKSKLSCWSTVNMYLGNA